MKKNAKDNLKSALNELNCCENHLNSAYMKADDTHNRNEINTALKSVCNAVESAQDALRKYKD